MQLAENNPAGERRVRSRHGAAGEMDADLKTVASVVTLMHRKRIRAANGTLVQNCWHLVYISTGPSS